MTATKEHHTLIPPHGGYRALKSYQMKEQHPAYDDIEKV